MRVSAKTHYGLRALLVLAARTPALVKLDTLTSEQGLPRTFVESILRELRRAGFAHSPYS
jgi:DNA-binding IscR family transcriptional regulator